LTVIREPYHMKGVHHQLCGKLGCRKRVGHGRHYGLGGPAYMCECGFASTTRRELERHLKQAAKANKLSGQRTFEEALEGQVNPLKPILEVGA